MAPVFAGQGLDQPGPEACAFGAVAGWCGGKITGDPVGAEEGGIGNFLPPQMGGRDSARVVAQEFGLDEGGVARSQDGTPVRVHGVECQKTGEASGVAPGGSARQSGRLEGQAEAKLSVQDDLVLAHVAEGLVENPLDCGMIQGLASHAQEPGLQMGYYGFRADHAPDLKVLCPHALYDGIEREEWAEDAVIGEQDFVCVPVAATGEQELPGSEVQSGIGAGMDGCWDRRCAACEVIVQ